MKATLTFTLPDEDSQYSDAVNGYKMRTILWDVDQWLRANEFKFNMEETSFFVGKVKVIAKDPSIVTRLFIFNHDLA